MKKKKKSNSGFTLVELIIAMAILAFLMTAVSAFMSTGVFSFKKAKADITVHNSAQDVYDQLADSVMSANSIVIYGYVAQGSLTGSPVGEQEFGISGKDTTVNLEGPYYFIRNKEDADEITSLQNMKGYVSGTTVYSYEELPANTKIYVKQMIVDHSIAIDKDILDNSQAAIAGKYKNNFTNEEVEIKEQVREVDEVGGSADTVLATASDGSKVYSVNDTERNIFSFNEKYMYYERQYAFMTDLNDYETTGADVTDEAAMGPYVYSRSFNYLTIAGTTNNISGCVVTVDAEGGALGFDLYFSDKNMTYTTQGMINTRNSFVLRQKK